MEVDAAIILDALARTYDDECVAACSSLLEDLTAATRAPRAPPTRAAAAQHRTVGIQCTAPVAEVADRACLAAPTAHDAASQISVAATAATESHEARCLVLAATVSRLELELARARSDFVRANRIAERTQSIVSSSTATKPRVDADLPPPPQAAVIAPVAEVHPHVEIVSIAPTCQSCEELRSSNDDLERRLQEMSTENERLRERLDATHFLLKRHVVS